MYIIINYKSLFNFLFKIILIEIHIKRLENNTLENSGYSLRDSVNQKGRLKNRFRVLVNSLTQI